MRLRDIDFGTVLGASGVQGFFGEGYAFHRWLRPFGLDFTGMTFVAKTTTLAARKGNMPLGPNHRPTQLFPHCIVVRPLDGAVLNAVGLSGPGAQTLLLEGRWQRRTSPFMLSFMATGADKHERADEVARFCRLLAAHLSAFRAPIALQLNFSCPNVRVPHAELAEEATAALDVAAMLGVPLVPKYNVLLPLDVAEEVARHPACDAICMSNALPWGSLHNKIDWYYLFGSERSPLADYGGGGLSGAPLLPLVGAWVRKALARRLPVPIIAGGGILSPRDARTLLDAGAAAVSLGSIAILRGWRVAATIREAAAHAAMQGAGHAYDHHTQA